MEPRDTNANIGVEPEVHAVKDQAKRLTDAARDRVLSTADDKKGVLAKQMADLASSVERQGNLGARLGGWLRELTTTIEGKSTQELLQSAERQIKAHPAAFITGCVAVGFLGARLARR